MTTGLPLVLHLHDGEPSHLADDLGAVVISVRSAVVDEGWNVLRTVVRQASDWGVDPARVAVLGEGTGGLVAAVVALRARDRGLHLSAQVLVNPCLDAPTSPFWANDLFGLAPALVVVPTGDPLADRGREYAARLWSAGTRTQLTEHEGSPRAEILDFLRRQLGRRGRTWGQISRQPGLRLQI